MKKKKEEKEIYIEIGTRLRAARERMGFSLLHVSGVFEIGYQSLRRYESGETAIPLDLLFALAEFYAVKTEDLIPGAEIGENKKNEKAQLEKNIAILKKIYSVENEKAKRITNAAIEFLSKIADEI